MADATFSLACDGPGGGDRIRWTLVEPNTELRARLDGDTPQIEAVVEGFSPHAVFGADKLVELRVIRSWGQGRPPAPGDSLDQRTRMVAEAEKEVGLDRGHDAGCSRPGCMVATHNAVLYVAAGNGWRLPRKTSKPESTGGRTNRCIFRPLRHHRRESR